MSDMLQLVGNNHLSRKFTQVSQSLKIATGEVTIRPTPITATFAALTCVSLRLRSVSYDKLKHIEHASHNGILRNDFFVKRRT